VGRRGPRPEPTKLKLLKGNPGKRKISTREPKPAPVDGAPKCPVWMPADGRREWKRVVPELMRLGILSVVDVASLQGYCASYARALEADRHVKRMGLTIATKTGFFVQNPAVSIARLAWQAQRQFAAEFGLTPSARTRIEMPTTPPTTPDDAEGFLFGASGRSQA
jgi:P27 family predicted phage terminase small subunit